MSVQCFLFQFVVCVLLLQHPPAASHAFPLSLDILNASNVVNTIRNIPGRVWNFTKNISSKPSGTTVLPPTTTKVPVKILLLPYKWSNSGRNVSENQRPINSSALNKSLLNPTESSNIFKKAKNGIMNRIKAFVYPGTTTMRPELFLPVPVSSRLMAERFAQERKSQWGKHKSDVQGHQSITQAGGFSWWVLVVGVLVGVVMGAGAWMAVMRWRSPGAALVAWNAAKTKPQSAWRWFCRRSADAHPHPHPHDRPPLPVPATARPALPAIPAIPALPFTHRVNPFYQAKAAAVHVYAVPFCGPLSGRPLPPGAAAASEHVHVYEIPPCFPAYDNADQEIDTTMLGKVPFAQQKAKC